MGNSPQKKSGKNFLMGDFHAIHYPMGNFPHKKNFSIQEIPTTFFPMGNSLLFYPKNPMGNSHFFFYGKSPLLFTIPPYGKFPKKIWKKIFLRDIWTTVPPKMGVPPGERGHGGDTYPPYGVCGGGDYLLRLLVRVLVRVLLV